MGSQEIRITELFTAKGTNLVRVWERNISLNGMVFNRVKIVILTHAWVWKTWSIIWAFVIDCLTWLICLFNFGWTGWLIIEILYTFFSGTLKTAHNYHRIQKMTKIHRLLELLPRFRHFSYYRSFSVRDFRKMEHTVIMSFQFCLCSSSRIYDEVLALILEDRSSRALVQQLCLESATKMFKLSIWLINLEYSCFQFDDQFTHTMNGANVLSGGPLIFTFSFFFPNLT